MVESNTMLAQLSWRLTNRTEDVAVEALGYILNKSGDARDALAALVGMDVRNLEKIRTQVTVEGRRPDLICSAGTSMNVIIEAKFWAHLSEGQARDYLENLSDFGVLLFVGPGARIDNLWCDIKGDISAKLGSDIFNADSRRAYVEGTDKAVMITSWENLLNSMIQAASGSLEVQADIRQLAGLTRRMDEEALLPFSKADLSPQIARRMRDLRRIYDDVIARCKGEGWVTQWGGTSRFPQSAYGQFWQISGMEGWFGVFYDLWARGDCPDTPFWLELYDCPHSVLDEIDKRMGVRTIEEMRIPIYISVGLERQEIVDLVVAQLEAISKVIEEAATV